MAHWNPSSPDVSEIGTGPLPDKPASPRDWGDLTVSILAPRARHEMEPREFIQTALERAYRERIEGTLRFHGIQHGLILYGAPVRGNPAQEWRITIDVPGQNITCNCPLRQGGHPCGHVGAAMLLLRRIQDATATRACTHQRQIDQWSEALHLHG